MGKIFEIYGLSILLSFVTILTLTLLWRPKEIAAKFVFGAFLVNFLFAFFGANLLNILMHLGEHKGQSIGEIFSNSGVAYLGAPVLGLFAFWVYCKIIKIPFLVFADYAAPFYMLDRAIGRVGCLGYGCCYGIPSNLPWAYTFRSWGITEFVPRHPTQAYAIIAALSIFFASRYFYKKTKSVPGVFDLDYKKAPISGITFFFVIFFYSLLRFLNEFLRAEGPYMIGIFKYSHLALLLFLIVSVVFLVRLITASPSKKDLIAILRSASLRLAIWLVIISGV
ncbi:MAG: prolipoprotein diacylglyceryl transferase, partial [Candidatus Omnitrophica bacterium]|nr:prolipoprotein diacylglyceryl transferase [Candidatus Omnitrophota bacterium]